MGLFSKFKQSDLYFLYKTGISRSTVKGICRDLSNRYLTPNNPGKQYIPGLGEIEVVTSLPLLKVTINGTYWFDRSCVVIQSLGEQIPLWDKRVEDVLLLFKFFRDHGIAIPMNNEGVIYYRMPGEHEDVGHA